MRQTLDQVPETREESCEVLGDADEKLLARRAAKELLHGALISRTCWKTPHVRRSMGCVACSSNFSRLQRRRSLFIDHAIYVVLPEAAVEVEGWTFPEAQSALQCQDEESSAVR